jgi:predicted ATPase
MLKSWHIKNFKPILDSGDLKLAPVTVLAGRNSSGKSSLIQSILMIAQTLSNRILDRSLLPNGPIVQLGTFEDILSEQTSLRTLEVGFELEMEKDKSKVLTSARTRLEEDRRIMAGLSNGINSVKLTSKFQSASGNGASASAIEASKVNVESVSLEVVTALSVYSQMALFQEQNLSSETLFSFGVNIQRLTSEELEQFLKGVLSEYLRLVPYPLQEPNYLGEFISENPNLLDHLPNPSLVTLSHFLPTRLFGKYIIEERRKQLLVDIVREALLDPVDHTSRLKVFFDQHDQDALILNSVKKSLTGFCKDKNIVEDFSGETFVDLIIWYRSIIRQKKRGMRTEILEIITQGISEASSQIDSGNEKGKEAIEAITNNIYVENLEKAVGQITQFFTSRIRYLGPLRADPQAAQRFAPSSELDDVGAKGEYAAAVYDANQMAPTEWFNPLKKSVERNTLKVALDTWVRYLGVANEVKIQVAGQSGVSWQVVHIEGHKALPLTAIGVGVSQILPILVMGLLAPNNTLLLVEQPELHLHPSVQARLGDFFMGLAQCGKQCLIETHSENLISQLRYHIVRAGGQENSNCLIYFVEQDEQGASKFNPIEISAKGNILNWPDGFFDETMLQEDRITAEGLKKRVKNGKND